ncbi:MAG: hypothetical protein F6J97_03050 [Leptolyngbya sp. SIO4C1]|nr:hypothetical protein [Leptolyngbya sp. SIO4C1]
MQLSNDTHRGNSNMTVAVLSQLEQAEALLSEQEAALAQQLAEIQEKRKGVQTVIGMFSESADSDESAAEIAAPDAVEAREEVVETSTADSQAPDDTSEDTPEADAAPAPTSAKSSQSATKSATKKTRKSGKAKRVDGRAAQWQRYLFDDYRQQPLPETVASVLKSQAEDSFKIADVMSVLFVEDMPKAQFLKARNRISNILSAGARDGDWHRGRGGTYSMSSAAVKTS